MTTTTNLGLKKPENSDYVDVSVINENMDKLDEAVPSAAENALKAAATKDAPADNDGFPVVDSADSNKVKRVLWSKIKALFAPATHAAQHGSAGRDPVTPADIGAVSKTGDTMTGDLQMISGNALSFHASDADWNRSPWFSLMRQNHGLKLTVRNNGLNRLFYFNDNTAALKDALMLWYYDDGSEHKATFLHDKNLSELGVAKIATGSYTGTGVVGENNPNSITFPFVPKVIMICGDGTQLLFGTDYGAHSVFGVLWDQLSSEYKSIANNRYSSMRVKATDKTLSWYSNKNASDAVAYQLNTSGEVYRYVAFG